MIENIESEEQTLEEKTTEIIENSGIPISKIIQETNSSDRIPELPIPLNQIEDDNNDVFMNPETITTLQEYLQKITNPETAFEYPLLLSGNVENNQIRISNVEILLEKNLQNEILKNTSYSKKQFEEIQKAKERGNNLLISTHTHPIPSEKIKQNSLTKDWSEEVKKKYGIKELGLNLSQQDIHQLVYLTESLEGFVSEDTKVMGAVLMHNGDFVIYSIEDGTLKKFVTNIKE